MARYPGCVWKPYVDAKAEPRILPAQFILHSMSSPADEDANWNYFNSMATSLESHFLVGYVKTIQGQDTDLQADANYKANQRAISVETRDNGNPNIFSWTPWQVNEIIRLMRLAHEIDKIPLRICRTPTDPGYGYHTLFGAPSEWTPVVKSCPGTIRIRQFHKVIWPKFLNSYRENVPMSDGVKPVLIRIGKDPKVYQIIGGAFRVHIPDSTSMTLMGWDGKDVQSVPPTHKFALLPILSVTK